MLLEKVKGGKASFTRGKIKLLIYNLYLPVHLCVSSFLFLGVPFICTDVLFFRAVEDSSLHCTMLIF